MKKANSLIMFLALCMAGCVGSPTQPSTFYALSADPGTPLERGAAPVSLGLGPVVLPDLFDRPQIVTRPDSNRVEMSEYDRWGGNLNRDLGRVLMQNLMARLDTQDIVLYPWPGSRQFDYQVTIQFFRFDGQVGESARLEGLWRLLDGGKGCELSVDHFRIEEPAAGEGYAVFVSAMSRAVARLSDTIAGQVVATEPGCPDR